MTELPSKPVRKREGAGIRHARRMRTNLTRSDVSDAILNAREHASEIYENPNATYATHDPYPNGPRTGNRPLPQPGTNEHAALIEHITTLKRQGRSDITIGLQLGWSQQTITKFRKLNNIPHFHRRSARD